MSDYIAVFIALATLALVAFVANRMERKYREEHEEVSDALEDTVEEMNTVYARLSRLERKAPTDAVTPSSGPPTYSQEIHPKERYVVEPGITRRVCLPLELDPDFLVEITPLGHDWKVYVDTRTNKVHDCAKHWDKLLNVLLKGRLGIPDPDPDHDHA